jgi:hypothetical protein
VERKPEIQIFRWRLLIPVLEYPGRFPVCHFTGKIQSQGNICQGNGEKRFQDDSPDNERPDIFPAFSIRRPPASLWLRLGAPGLLRLLAAVLLTTGGWRMVFEIIKTPGATQGASRKR